MMQQQPDGRRTERIREPRSLVSVLIVGLSYGARNVISSTRCMMQHFLAFRDSPIIPLRRTPPTLLGITRDRYARQASAPLVEDDVQ